MEIASEEKTVKLSEIKIGSCFCLRDSPQNSEILIKLTPERIRNSPAFSWRAEIW